MTLKKIIYGKKLTDLDLQILDYIVSNIDEALVEGVRSVAKNTYTSPSTVVRLSQELGYSGFVEMCYELKPLLNETDHVKVHDSNYDFMKNLYDYNSKEAVHKIIKSFPHKKELIFIYATGFSGIIGEYLYKKLLVKGYKVVFSDNSDSVAVFENSLSDMKLFIAISKSGTTPEVLGKVLEAKNHKVPILSITNEIANPLSKNSSSVIKIKDSCKHDDRNTHLNYFFSEAIFVIETILTEV